MLVFVAGRTSPTGDITTADVRHTAKQSKIRAGCVLKGRPPLFGLGSMNFHKMVLQTQYGNLFSVWREVPASHLLHSHVHQPMGALGVPYSLRVPHERVLQLHKFLYCYLGSTRVLLAIVFFNTLSALLSTSTSLLSGTFSYYQVLCEGNPCSISL